MADLEALNARLTTYIQNDSERWHAVHQRIEAVSSATMIVMLSVANANAGVKEEIKAGLRVAIEEERKRNTHDAMIGEMRRFQQALRDS